MKSRRCWPTTCPRIPELNCLEVKRRKIELAVLFQLYNGRGEEFMAFFIRQDFPNMSSLVEGACLFRFRRGGRVGGAATLFHEPRRCSRLVWVRRGGVLRLVNNVTARETSDALIECLWLAPIKSRLFDGKATDSSASSAKNWDVPVITVS